MNKEWTPPEHKDIGRGTYYAPDTKFVRYSENERIEIGNYCSIARGVTLSVGGNHDYELVSTFPFDSERSYRTTRSTILEHDVWVGENAYIGGGAFVGTGCVVGANAVLIGGDYPPYSIVTGNPGTYLTVRSGTRLLPRLRFDPETIRRLLRTKWWEWSDELIKERREWFYQPVGKFLNEFDPGD